MARSRGLGDVYKRQVEDFENAFNDVSPLKARIALLLQCLLSQDGASSAATDRL
jgi:hypothetical protein